MHAEQKTALVLTIGTGRMQDLEGSLVNPVRRSVDKGKPWALVLLLPSHKTHETAQLLKERLASPAVEVSDPLPEGAEEDVDVCYEHFDHAFRRILDRGFRSQDITVDFTRGTKVMSAAIVMVSIRYDIPVLRYVSGPRDSMGSVIAGKERIQEVGPTRVTGYRKLDRALQFVRSGAFSAAVDMLPELAEPWLKLYPEDLVLNIQALRGAAFFYSEWNRLEYKPASTSAPQIEPTDPRVRNCLPTRAMRGWVKRLAEVRKPDPSTYSLLLAVDLLVNAERRIREKHFEDAKIRLYRTAELACQSRLFHHHLDSERIPPDNPAIRELEKQGARFSRSSARSTIRVSAIKIPDLLEVLEDEHARRLKQMWRDPSLALKSRHESLLTHALGPSSPWPPDRYRRVVKELEAILVEMGGQLVAKALRVCRSTPDFRGEA